MFSPRIHKRNNALLPNVVHYTGSIAYNVSKSLAELLSPLAEKSEHHCSNYKHLAKSLSQIFIQKDEVFILQDVVSLLITNTSTKESSQFIHDRLVHDKD